MVTPEGLGGRAQLTSHPPVLLQLPGGYKHGDLSVSPVPEILHRHGNAPAGEEVLETVPGGGVGVRGTNEGAIFCPRNGPASPPSLRTSPGQHRISFSIIPSKEHPGLISFRVDLMDLLAVQGTLKSLLFSLDINLIDLHSVNTGQLMLEDEEA